MPADSHTVREGIVQHGRTTKYGKIGILRGSLALPPLAKSANVLRPDLSVGARVDTLLVSYGADALRHVMHASLGRHSAPFELICPKSHPRVLTCALIYCAGCEYQAYSLRFDSDTSILTTTESSVIMGRLPAGPTLVRSPFLPA